MIWYSEEKEKVLETLQTDAQDGISAEQAAERLEKTGPNQLMEKAPQSFFRRFLGQLKNAMVIILILAAAVSLGLSVYNTFQGLEADWVEPIVIVLILSLIHI